MNKPATGGQEELRAFLDRYPATQFLELLQPDMLGVLRGKRVVRAEFAKPFKDGVNFCGATVLLDSKGQTFERIDNGGRDGDPDVISTAVPGSLAPVPRQSRDTVVRSAKSGRTGSHQPWWLA